MNYQDFASYIQKNEARIWQAFRCLALVAYEPATQFAGQRQLSADVLIILGVQSASTICADDMISIDLLSDMHSTPVPEVLKAA